MSQYTVIEYRYFIKFAYDCSFHILIIVIMTNILFGIIIDTFACKLVFLVTRYRTERPHERNGRRHA